MRFHSRGFILVVSLGILASLLILALGLINLGQALTGVSLQVEDDLKETEAINAGLLEMRDVLQADPAFVTPAQAFLGLGSSPNSAPVASEPGVAGSTTLSYQHGDDGQLSLGQAPGAVVLNGQFNGGQLSSSINLPVPTTFSLSNDGYDHNLVASSNITVPAQHASVFMQSHIAGQTQAVVAADYSAAWPYGLMGKSVTVLDMGAATDLTGDVQSGVPVLIFSNGGDTSSPAFSGAYLNGRLYSTEPLSSFHLNNPGGVVFANSPIPQGVVSSSDIRPAAFMNGFNAALTAIRPASPADTSGLLALATALHDVIPGGTPLIFPSGAFDFSQTVSTAINNAATVTSGAVNASTFTENPFSFNFTGGLTIPATPPEIVINLGKPLALLAPGADLFLDDNAVLVVVGGLSCGRIYMGNHSTLLVQGGPLLCNQIDVRTSSLEGVTATVLADGNITCNEMTQTLGVTDSHGGNLFGAAANIVPPNEGSALITVGLSTSGVTGGNGEQVSEFNSIASNNVAALNSNAILQSLLGTINHAGETVNSGLSAPVPGALVASTSGTVGVGLSAISKASGLIMGPGTVSAGVRLVGVAWSGNGSVTSSEYRYFPYDTHAYIQTPAGTVLAAANNYHVTAYGRADH